MMLVLVTEFTSTNVLWQVEEQHLSPQLLEINSLELATRDTRNDFADAD
jgi:hypothetical protein